MTAMSDYLENKVLDHVLGTSAYTAPSDIYVGLFAAAPNDAGGGTEVSGSGYARQTAAFDAASEGSTANSALVEFLPSGGDWGTVTHIGLFDALTNGNLLYHGALVAPKVTADGDPVQFPAGNLTVEQD